MKLLHVTDFHGNPKWYEWLRVTCEKRVYDAVFLTGDLINSVGPLAFEETIEVHRVIEAIRAEGSKLYVCSGNHDLWFQLGAWGWIEQQHGTFFLDEITVTSISWKIPGYDEGEWGEELELELDKLRAVARRTGKPWCVLQHCPPFDCAIGRTHVEPDPADIQLSALAWEPDFLFCGHIHLPQRSGGDWTDTVTGESGQVTRLFNAGVAPRVKIPNHIELDTTLRTAVWRSVDDRNPVTTLRERIVTW